MLDEFHELLGGAGAFTLTAVVALGAALYFYPRLRQALPLPRGRLVQLHRWGAILFLPLTLTHYLLAPNVHPLQPLGAGGLAGAFALGWLLRLDRRHYQALVQAKAVLVLVAVVALLSGHLLVEHGAGEEDGHHGSVRAARFGFVAAATAGPRAPATEVSGRAAG